MKTFWNGNVVRKYVPADFIEAVWQFPRHALKTPPDGYKFPKESLLEYEAGSYKKYGTSAEQTAYKPLHAILAHLVSQINLFYAIQ